ncbi:MAG: DUF262 domain-containing protein [Rhodothermaceae bacterium]|nr:DUF262 domain-containing protein [Rhodothermaceae bacterium]
MATDPVNPEFEEPEGIGSDEDSSWGDYPLDTVLIRNESRTVADVLRRINQGRYVLDPDFQRDFIWTDLKQSKLIESVLMRIPLPVLYLAEDSEGRMIVVDGLQRLSTFNRFVDGELSLRLKDQVELNGKRFGDLSPKLQNRIEDCNLTLYIIDSKVPERARLDIFERVNSGVPLTRQQMRNSLYSGPGTLFLKKEALTPLFLEATGHSLRTASMRDREFVNRFCGFQLLTPGKYRGEMDDFLADTLEHMNRMQEVELSRLSAEFRTGLNNNVIVFGEHAFRKHFEGQTRRSVINASLWDIMSTGLSRFPTDLVESQVKHLRDALHGLMNDESFIASITYGTNDTRRVKHRFDAASKMFQEVFGAHPT